MAYNPVIPTDGRWIAEQVPAVLCVVLPVSAVVSLYLLLARRTARDGNRLVSFVVLVICGVAALYASASLPQTFFGETSCSVGAPPNPVIPERIHPAAPNPFYAGLVASALDGELTVRPLVTAALTTSAPGTLFVPPRETDTLGRTLAYYQQAAVNTARGTMSVSGESTRLSPANPTYGAAFAPPAFLSAIIREVDQFNRYLHELSEYGPSRLAFAVFAVVLFAVGCRLFLRFSGWPLLNAMATLFLARGIFLLVSALNSEVGHELAAILPDPQMATNLPAGVLLVLGALFALIDLLFSPRRGRKGR